MYATFSDAPNFFKFSLSTIIAIGTTSGSEYKLTTKKWLTPKGNLIHKKGVMPDIEIELSDEYKNDPTEENDNQYQKAIEEAIKES